MFVAKKKSANSTHLRNIFKIKNSNTYAIDYEPPLLVSSLRF